MRFFIFPFLFFFPIVACINSNEALDDSSEEVITIIPAFPNLSFNRPVDLQHSGDQSNRLFVVEQAGIIFFFNNSNNVSEKTVFLDIQNRVDDRFTEEGLLGLAFHPSFSENGYFFVNYTASNPDRTVISRFQITSDSQRKADPNSELILLEYEQPYANHNGGQISFGPDGYLYTAIMGGKSRKAFITFLDQLLLN